MECQNELDTELASELQLYSNASEYIILLYY